MQDHQLSALKKDAPSKRGKRIGTLKELLEAHPELEEVWADATEQKRQNRDLASRHISVEHVLRTLKRSRILSSNYRDCRKRFGLRLNLIAAIANLHK